MTAPTWQILNVGDVVPLKTVLGNIYFMGVVTDPNVPNQFAATMEMYGDTAVVTVPILQGPPGVPGQPMFALRFQNDTLADVPDPEHLPILTNTAADLGKYWIFAERDELGNVVSTSMFVWYGTEYRQLPVGSQGPPGPYPVISPTIIPEPPGSTNGPNGESDWVEVQGGPAAPNWILHLTKLYGEQGIAGEALGQAGDVLLTDVQPGDVLVAGPNVNPEGQRIWINERPKLLVPSWYTVPESAFSSFAGITGNDVTICTFGVPQQIFDWKPIVWGQLRVFGAQLDPTPFLIGANVRLGHPTTGKIVASGHGNAFGTIDLFPHPSTAATPNDAITPTNSYARVTKAHTGTAGTLYCNLINEGFGSLFNFNADGAALVVGASPVPAAA
jgi:hypothetical protein